MTTHSGHAFPPLLGRPANRGREHQVSRAFANGTQPLLEENTTMYDYLLPYAMPALGIAALAVIAALMAAFLCLRQRHFRSK